MSIKEVIHTNNAPAPVGPYNQAIAIPATAKLLFLAGQISIDPATGQLIDSNDVTLQTKQVLENMKAVLAASGASLADVVKTTVFLANMADFPAMNQVYAQYFTDAAPARSCVEAARLPKDVLVEIECIAAIAT